MNTFAGINLPSLLTIAEQNNKDLISARRNVVADANDTAFAATIPNPVFGASALAAPQRQTRVFASVSQELRFGVYAARRVVSRSTYERSLLIYKEQQAEVQQAITSVYYQWQITNRRLLVQRTAHDGWKDLEKVANQKAATGVISDIESGTVHQNVLSARQRVLELESEKQQIESELAELIGKSMLPDTILPQIDDTLPVLPTLDSLLSWAHLYSPHLAAQRAELNLANKTLTLENRAALPHPSVAVNAEHEADGTDWIGVGVEFPLPLFDRNKSAINRTAAELDKSKAGQESALRVTDAQIQRLHKTLTTLDEQIRNWITDGAPSAAKQIELTRQGFSKGQLSVFDLSKIQTELLDQNMRVFDYYEQYYIGLSHLALLIGRKFL